MTKRLYLLRHAQAGSSFGNSDIERKLTAKGLDDAIALGKTMQKKSYLPALTLCSPATRTQQTFKCIKETLEGLKSETPDTLYGAAPGEMLDLIQSTDDSYESLLIVAHNPTIHHIAAMLSNENSEFYNTITMQYAPGTLSVLDCNIESWKDIQPGENQLIDLITP